MKKSENPLIKLSYGELIHKFGIFLMDCCYYSYSIDHPEERPKFLIPDMEELHLEWKLFFARRLDDISKGIGEKTKFSEAKSVTDRVLLTTALFSVKDLHEARMKKWKDTKFEPLFDSLGIAIEGDNIDEELLMLAKLRNEFYLKYGHSPEFDNPLEKIKI